MNRLILTSIMVLITVATAVAEVSLPKDKFSQHDYNTLIRLNKDREVEIWIRIQKAENRGQIIEELQQLGVNIVGTEEDKIIIRTTVEKLNKVASSDEIILIEKEGKEPKVKRARAVSKSDSTSIIQAQVLCDNPPQDYQTQIQDLGAKIIKIENNIVDIEVVGYEILNKIGHLNYVMRIGNIREILVPEVIKKDKKKDKAEKE